MDQPNLHAFLQHCNTAGVLMCCLSIFPCGKYIVLLLQLCYYGRIRQHWVLKSEYNIILDRIML